MNSAGSSSDVKNERSNDRARFRPSAFIPLRMNFITGGNMSSVIVRPFMSRAAPSYFFVVGFGAFSRPHSRACCNNSLASPSIESGMKDFISTIFRGSASESVKSSICSFEIGIDAKAVFSWREYGALNKCRDETRTTSTASSVDFIVSSTLNCSIVFCRTWPPNDDVASSFAVLILHVSQKSTSRSLAMFIFALQDGQSIATLFFVKPSSSVLHFMSGQTYL